MHSSIRAKSNLLYVKNMDLTRPKHDKTFKEKDQPCVETREHIELSDDQHPMTKESGLFINSPLSVVFVEMSRHVQNKSDGLGKP